MNILVIAPHPDDETIGCGGSLRMHARRGDRVHVAFLTSGELGLSHLAPEEAWSIREAEARAAAEVLGLEQLHFLHRPDWYVRADRFLISAIADLVREVAPAWVYLPHGAEWHKDHRAAWRATHAALRVSAAEGVRPGTREYEVWTPLHTFSGIEDITAVEEVKQQAIACYASQLSQFAYGEAVRGLNRYRGELGARCKYAEVFTETFPR